MAGRADGPASALAQEQERSVFGVFHPLAALLEIYLNGCTTGGRGTAGCALAAPGGTEAAQCGWLPCARLVGHSSTCLPFVTKAAHYRAAASRLQPRWGVCLPQGARLIRSQSHG